MQPRYASAFVLACMLAACNGPTTPPDAAVVQEATATQGDFTVRATTLQTSALSPAMAREYGLERSENTVMLLVMTRRLDNGQERAAAAQVKARVRDLRGRTHTLALRELRMQAGGETLVDHVGVLDVSLPETLSFDIEVVPRGGNVITMQFTRDFVPR